MQMALEGSAMSSPSSYKNYI